MSLIDKIKESVIAGHPDMNSKYPPDLAGQQGVMEYVNQALQEKVPVSQILNAGLIAAMEDVGEKFSSGEYFVPEMLMSAKAMKTGMALIEPLLKSEGTEKIGTVILGTVMGDMHDIGKNLVALFLEGNGFQVIDLGINTPIDKFVTAAKEHPKAIIGMSALLTTTMENMRTTIDGLRANDQNHKVIIGGAATSQQFAEEIGAEGYSRDAAQAVPLVKRLMGIGA